MPFEVSPDLKALLDSEAARIDNPSFIALDPVQFPRMFSALQDIEIVALLCSSIAWGNRKMICRNCEKMLALMGHDPYRYVMDRAYEDLPDCNIHRTFFARDFRHYLRGLNRIYSRHASLDAFAAAEGVGQSEFAPWRLAEVINRELALANDGNGDSRCLPLNLSTTALKRLNMALRWLVRRDGIVDMGVWGIADSRAALHSAGCPRRQHRPGARSRHPTRQRPPHSRGADGNPARSPSRRSRFL